MVGYSCSTCQATGIHRWTSEGSAQVCLHLPTFEKCFKTKNKKRVSTRFQKCGVNNFVGHASDLTNEKKKKIFFWRKEEFLLRRSPVWHSPASFRVPVRVCVYVRVLVVSVCLCVRCVLDFKNRTFFFTFRQNFFFFFSFLPGRGSVCRLFNFCLLVVSRCQRFLDVA